MKHTLESAKFFPPQVSLRWENVREKKTKIERERKIEKESGRKTENEREKEREREERRMCGRRKG